jgi:hypothetical protein
LGWNGTAVRAIALLTVVITGAIGPSTRINTFRRHASREYPCFSVFPRVRQKKFQRDAERNPHECRKYGVRGMTPHGAWALSVSVMRTVRTATSGSAQRATVAWSIFRSRAETESYLRSRCDRKSASPAQIYARHWSLTAFSSIASMNNVSVLERKI